MKFWYAVLTRVNVLPDEFNVGSRRAIDEIGNSVVAKSSDTTKPLSMQKFFIRFSSSTGITEKFKKDLMTEERNPRTRGKQQKDRAIIIQHGIFPGLLHGPLKMMGQHALSAGFANDAKLGGADDIQDGCTAFQGTWTGWRILPQRTSGNSTMGNAKSGTWGGITPGANQLESSFTVEDLGILVDKFTMNQQYALLAKKAHSLLGCIRQSVDRMSGELINPSDYPLDPSDSL
ncbi:rna-directed dna polymerase from mobile element jockey- hypothetical protein [Limosa lapponica baueri]|uniref:Uncharacterized protein n=1 Tax=Limosa lapponica baueri TaxID=1758121 RepID=A0A2I0U2C6_LIMLA|nr:rna-directed dna polymerase from mobile element jockey- hypothetical protein [Limosa lapponica baueri]